MTTHVGNEITEFLERPIRDGDFVIVGNPATGWFGQVIGAYWADTTLSIKHLGGAHHRQMEWVPAADCWPVAVLQTTTINESAAT